jgi:flagellar protein FlaG
MMEIRPVSYSGAHTAPSTEKTNTQPALSDSAAKPTAAPTTESAVRQPSRSTEIEQTKHAVQDIERMMKLFSRNVEFAYDSEQNRAIMRVVDQETREVIRQVPTKEALEIAKALTKIQDMLLVQDAKSPGGR